MGCEGKGNGETQKHAFQRGIPSLFQEHSPGDATVTLCLICYYLHDKSDDEIRRGYPRVRGRELNNSGVFLDIAELYIGNSATICH